MTGDTAAHNLTCPHCSQENPPGSGWCAFCGKALPSLSLESRQPVESVKVGPAEKSVPELRPVYNTAKKTAKSWLLFIAIVQTFVTWTKTLGPHAGPLTNNSILLLVMTAIAWALYGAMFVLPLTAASVALVGYGLFWIYDFTLSHAQMPWLRLIIYVVIKFFILVSLIHFIVTCVRYRRALRSAGLSERDVAASHAPLPLA